MTFWNWLNGCIRVQLRSGDCLGALAAVSNGGISIIDGICREDGITAEFTILRQHYPQLRNLAKRKGYDLQIVALGGLFWKAENLLRRPVLIVTCLLLLFLTTFLPTRILFVRVEGNSTVPANRILEVCADNGIRFGGSRSLVRSERIKNRLLEEIGELQWVGVTTNGCVATVSVTERQIHAPQKEKERAGCIVAGMDGRITAFTVTRGTVLCRIGQAVCKGDLLVSGYIDSGNYLQIVGAEGEVYAQTQRQITAIRPLYWQQEGEIRAEKEKFALKIGKKRINFYKGSGISGATCDKIYEEKYITLPGGFQLPIAIIRERWIFYDTAQSGTEIPQSLFQQTEQYLLSQMQAGRIDESEVDVMQEDGFAYLQGNYICTEMIGRMENEEIMKPYGNDN